MSAWETLWKILGEEFADLADFEQTARAALRLLLAAASRRGTRLRARAERQGRRPAHAHAGNPRRGAVRHAAAIAEWRGGRAGRVIQGTVAGIRLPLRRHHPQGRSGKPGRGLTTAAGLWASTAIGVAVGLGHQGTAVLGTVLALLVLHVLACLNRSPPSSDSH
ncbi:MgtC/SapB family protein [Pseudomonas aeruginosa]